jgi:hypothetical protein
MQAYLTIEEARKKNRAPIQANSTYIFYSDCVNCKSDNNVLIRHYSGQAVTVLQGPSDDGVETNFTVRAANGDTFVANEGELNGWIFDTGQWVGPRVN